MNPDPARLQSKSTACPCTSRSTRAGIPVLLMHGWPDSARLWRNQVPFLVSNGFR